MLITEQVFLRRLLLLYTYPIRYPNPLANDLAEIVRIQGRLLEILFDPTTDHCAEMEWDQWLICWKNHKLLDRQMTTIVALEGVKKE